MFILRTAYALVSLAGVGLCAPVIAASKPVLPETLNLYIGLFAPLRPVGPVAPV